VHQDVRLYSTVLGADEDADLVLADGRMAWVQVARGEVLINGMPLANGDGASLVGEPSVTLSGVTDAEVLLFDLPG
jgi:redox-sensitive bicupin YhaK (pirin superfamily)